jgi:hypothetical protein
MTVAEKIEAPLYKMELGDESDQAQRRKLKRDINYDSDDESPPPLTIEKEFELAARWNAVLLIDECDTYLEKRADNDPLRNRIVSSMHTPLFLRLVNCAFGCN